MKKESDKTDIIISVVFIIVFIVIIVVIVISGVCVAFNRKKQKGKPEFIDTTADGPLHFDNEDEEMFQNNLSAGCKRFVPTMVEKFEEMGTDGSKLTEDSQVTMIN